MITQKQKIQFKAKKQKTKLIQSADTIVLPLRAVVERLLKVMKKHIGEEKRISRFNLFKLVYNVDPMELKPLYTYVMWDILKRGMHTCRQRTKCQIVSKRFAVNKGPKSKKYQGGIYYYWVANTYFDYKIYRDVLEKNIVAMRRSEKRLEKSIKEKWYKEEWKI